MVAKNSTLKELSPCYSRLNLSCPFNIDSEFLTTSLSRVLFLFGTILCRGASYYVAVFSYLQ